MANRFSLLSILLFLPLLVFSQNSKRALDHADISKWNSIRSSKISHNGQWVTYTLSPLEGDGKTILYNAVSKKEWVFERSEIPAFSFDNQFLVFKIKPAQENIRQLKLDKVDKDKWPQDSLGILNLQSQELQKLPFLKSFKLSDKWGSVLTAHFGAEAHQEEKKQKSKNGPLVIWDLSKNKEFRVPNANNYALAENSAKVLLSTSEKKFSTVKLFDVNKGSFQDIWSDSLDCKSMNIASQGDQVAFITLKEKEAESVAVHHWKSSNNQLKVVANVDSRFLKENWVISEHASPRFKEDGSQLFFGIAPPLPKKDETILDDERPVVEVWNYKDKRTYPQQKIQLKNDQRKYFSCLMDTQSGKIIQLANQELPNVSIDVRSPSKWLIAYEDEAFRRQSSWEGGPTHKNIYLINGSTGEKELVAEKMRGSAQMSPSGKYLYWYNFPESSWFVYSLATKKTRNISKDLGVSISNELHDSPSYPGPYGIAGWTSNDDFLLLYDRYDIWQIDPQGNINPVNYFKGREKKRIHRYIKVDPNDRAIEEVAPMLIHFTDEETKEEGYLTFNLHTGVQKILQKGAFSYSRRPIKARNADRYIFTKENYQIFPDLQYSSDLKSSTKISTANPQQKEFNWGTMEMVEWTSLDGQRLKGLLVKPENFDPNKKYPLMVNFYEKSSQGLNRHRRPEFHRSTMNYPYYASKGYVIFNPDVPYKIGYPGESAYNSVIPGVTNLINQGFIDEKRIGLQGHSWGGYQIAYLVTRSDLFACAESGAPVVNMISAYGGIRWGSGASRMFQYEHTQSRIGGTLWDYPLRYMENSPIFTIDKIKTPVLILHNDNDGAVPWYQGIEFFMAMRRLDKPAWMLNYNNEPHWPLKLPNRKDFQKRMSQFFDHYLQGAPMPVWMDRGIPAMEKESNMGYEAVDKH